MMRNRMFTLALVSVLAVGAAQAQTQKPGNDKQQRIVLGTNQMAGDNGKFGLTYTIGQQSPINVTLTDARFSVARFNVGGNSIAPDKDEKLLVLTYTIHNPNPEITRYDAGTLKFTAVDQEDVNHEAPNAVTRKDGTDPLSVELKPAQKIEVRTVIVVPAKGTVPKLIVQHKSGGAVLRYDLRPQLKPLDAPFAGAGMDALEEVKADKDQFLPLMFFDAKFLSTSFQERRMGPTTIPDDKVFFLPKFTVKKQANTGHILRFHTQAVTEDGDRYDTTSIYKGSVDEYASSTAEFGQELTVRMVIVVPKKAKITAVRIWEEQGRNSRVYSFPVDATFAPATPAATSTAQAENKPAVTGLSGDEYVTVFKTAKGEPAMEASHTEIKTATERKTEITVAGQRAILVEDLATGATTLHLPATGETLRAPKPQGKEPQTSLGYYEMAYANAVAPKKKKNNLLGSVAGAVLGNAAQGLGQQMVSGSVLAAFGQASLPQLVNNGVRSQLQGYAVQEFATQLGRAVMTSAKPAEGEGPERVQDTVTVDKNVYAQTSFRARKALASDAFSFDAAAAQPVDATTLYKRFTEFMSQGLPK